MISLTECSPFTWNHIFRRSWAAPTHASCILRDKQHRSEMFILRCMLTGVGGIACCPHVQFYITLHEFCHNMWAHKACKCAVGTYAYEGKDIIKSCLWTSIMSRPSPLTYCNKAESRSLFCQETWWTEQNQSAQVRKDQGMPKKQHFDLSH